MSGQLILVADQRARGIIRIERYRDYLAALGVALPACDALVASAQPLGHLVASAAIAWDQRSYLSINHTGLAGSVFETDDRVVASLDAAAVAGYTGVKLTTRIDRSDRSGARALEVLGRVVSDARRLRIEALIEPASWSAGGADRSTSAIVFASIVAHDLGAPVLVVPVPADAEPGDARVSAAGRVVDSVGGPVLFLAGAGPTGATGAKAPDGGAGSRGGAGAGSAERAALLSETADVMVGGAAGVAIGPAIFGDPDPAFMARLVADIVRHEQSLDEVLGKLARYEGLDDSST